MSTAATIAALQRAQKRERAEVEYEYRKRRWVQEHPDATPEEYTRAIRAIAEDCGI